MKTPRKTIGPALLKRRAAAVAGTVALAGGLVALAHAPVWGSIFGEENLTLVQILAQMIHAKEELEDINDAAHASAEIMRDVKETYDRVNAGIDELQGYSWAHFVDDFTDDVYATYPGIGDLVGASADLKRWDDTRTRSPFTAYEAITAVAGDLNDALKDDVAAGHANVDDELIRHKEAAEALAQAQIAAEAATTFDEDVKELLELSENASPGQAAQLSTRAQVLIAAQNSHIIRLLSRSVRHEGVDMALDYAGRIRARNAAAGERDPLGTFFEDAARPPALIQFPPLGGDF